MTGAAVIMHWTKRTFTMKKTLFSLLIAVIFAAGTAEGQETPGWLRKNSISPDGSRIAFSYKGDIFVVPVSGGRALQLTTNAA